ncbi:MAG: abhydrolase domain-containing 18 [Blastocatellia bacterium]
MHKRERYFALLNDNRRVLPFEWGVEHLSEKVNGSDPRQFLLEFASRAVKNSDTFFSPPASVSFSIERRLFPASGPINPQKKRKFRQTEVTVVSWESAVTTPSPENNTALATYFPHRGGSQAAVIVLPHWNARAGTYFDLCRFFNRVGISAIRITLPYHEERMPPSLHRADYLVSPNIGRTLESVRQAILDTRTAVTFLQERGYRKIGIVGTSIGSCVAFMSFVHDLRINVAVFNHVSGYMADVVWHGLSTYHVRRGFEGKINLEELREYWMPVSPMAYMQKLAAMPARPQRYIYTKYDLSFPVELSRQTMRALRENGIAHSEVSLPCGHYTLGEKPWVYLDGFAIISFLRKHLKQDGD